MNLLDSRHTDEIAALLALDSAGSFVAAGRLLQRHPSILSKRLAAMEARLGVRLIERSTRQVRFTEAGLRLAGQLRLAAGLMAEAEQQASLGAAEVRGSLRLAVPAALGRLWLAPLLPEFLAGHPQVTLHIEYSERYVDVIAEGFDAAIRIGELRDNRLVALKLGEHRRILCASVAYLERHGRPQSPADLLNHNCLGFTSLSTYPQWKLVSAEQQCTITPQGTLASNDSEALLSATLAGVGILGAGDWLFRQALARHELARVLPQWELGSRGGIYLIRPSSRFACAASRAFRDWLQARFEQSFKAGTCPPDH